MAMSGFSVAMDSSACAASSASPHTDKSGSRLIICASQSRTMGWSSTINIRVLLVLGFIFFLYNAGGQILGERARDNRAAGCAAPHIKRRANHAGTVIH